MLLGFTLFFFALLLFDILFFRIRAKHQTYRHALIWVGFWIGLALLFDLCLFFTRGKEAALQFFIGYLLEKSLSLDNLFVFTAIFSYFQIGISAQQKILKWGVFGALLLRLCFILLGVALIEQFQWILYLLGAFLVVTGLKFFKLEKKEFEPEKSLIFQWGKKIFPLTHEMKGDRFFIKKKATLLFFILLLIEQADIIFALDSIPAIFAITTDSFIIYTSNAFAVMGLRSLHLIVSVLFKKLSTLKLGLGLVLIFVGLKMLFSYWYTLPLSITLEILLLLLIGSIFYSVYKKK